jgi:hypothetical protein
MLMVALQTIDPYLNIPNHRLSLYLACCSSAQTALLDLGKCTEYFQQLGPNDVRHVSIPNTATETRVDLVIDRNFYGLTPLNALEGEVVAE